MWKSRAVLKPYLRLRLWFMNGPIWIYLVWMNKALELVEELLHRNTNNHIFIFHHRLQFSSFSYINRTTIWSHIKKKNTTDMSRIVTDTRRMMCRKKYKHESTKCIWWIVDKITRSKLRTDQSCQSFCFFYLNTFSFFFSSFYWSYGLFSFPSPFFNSNPSQHSESSPFFSPVYP